MPEELRQKYAGKKNILTVRRLVPKNGIHYLVEAMPYIKEQVLGVVYLMIGAGRMEEYLKGRINELSLGDSVKMLGEIPNNEVAKYLKLADVVVFPSTAESSSIACAEAMAMRKKIVASRVGGLVELIGENNERGTLVRLVDWQGSNYEAPISLDRSRYLELAGAVIKDLQSDNDEKADKARQYAYDNLRWEVIARQTEKVFKELINKYHR